MGHYRKKRAILEDMISTLLEYAKKLHNTEPKYVFVGPPGSGKTVYFICAIDLLQRGMIDLHPERFALRAQNSETLKIQGGALAAMKKGKWPPKTQKSHTLSFVLSRHYEFVKWVPPVTLDYQLYYHDYPGEAFEDAFGDESTKQPLWEDAAQTLKQDLQKADGVFLVIDTPKFHDSGEEDYHLQLFRLFEYLDKNTRTKRVAVVFTKSDLFRNDHDFCPKRLLRERYPNIWNYLQRVKSEYFFVSAVASAAVDSKGGITPPKDYGTTQSERLIDPIVWMLELPS